MTRYIRPLLAGVLALAMMPQAALSADAPENRIAHSIVIDAPADKVWERVSDFVGLDSWFPFAESSTLKLGQNRQVGCIRELRRRNGTTVEEKRIAYDPWNMTLTYTYAGGEPLTSDYFATMTVTDAGNGKSRVDWTASFKRLYYWTDNPPPGQDDASLTALLNKVYTVSLDNLKKQLESK
jgi:mxaD protein